MIAVAYPFGGGLYANGPIDQRPSATLRRFESGFLSDLAM
jgi:hypothetical protein